MAEPGGVNKTRQHRRKWLALAVIALALWVARDFLTSLLWALILAIALWPLLRPMTANARGNTPALAALGVTLATGLLLMLPLALAAVAAAQESGVAIAWIQHAQQTGVQPPPWLAGIPIIGGRLNLAFQQFLGTPAGTSRLFASLDAGTVLGWTKALAGQVAQGSLLLFVTLVALYALLRHGTWLGERALRLVTRSVGSDNGDFAARLVDAVRATVVGTVFVALGEAALIGLGYAAAGVPKPVLFAVLTAAFAMLPFGAWLVFSIACAVLLLSGAPLAAALLFLYSAAVMLVGDNVVQPALIGRRAELPFVLALVGIFGGIATMGLVGLFVGPVIMSALVITTREWLD